MARAFGTSAARAIGPTIWFGGWLSIALAFGCGNPTAPTPTPAPVATPVPQPAVEPLSLSCPSPISMTTTANGAPVTYEVPSASGSKAPITVACAPSSGSTFPVGATDVRCTATDALDRTASCTFVVSVARLATISKTRFLAFGDSVTEGITSSIGPGGVEFLRAVPDAAYPLVLRQLLAARYPTQAITVLNEGKGGERAVDGIRRAASVVNANQPEVVLVLEGYNDLRLGEQAIEPAIAAISDIAKDARFRGARVFIATLTPPPISGNRGLSNTTVVRFNEKLRVVARGEGAVLVDLYQAWASDPNRYNSVDGLHPNEAGYRTIAQTFFAAIRSELEVR